MNDLEDEFVRLQAKRIISLTAEKEINEALYHDDIRELTAERDANHKLLEMAKKKLEIYRDNSDGEYHGGVEHTKLISLIEQALTTEVES